MPTARPAHINRSLAADLLDAQLDHNAAIAAAVIGPPTDDQLRQLTDATDLASALLDATNADDARAIHRLLSTPDPRYRNGSSPALLALDLPITAPAC